MINYQLKVSKCSPNVSSAILAFLIFCIATKGTFAQPGTLDPTFSQDGKLVVSIERDYGSAVMIQQDGRIIAAGTTEEDDVWKFAVLRITQDGTLDSTFNNSGKLTVNMQNNSNGYTQANDAVLQTDGKILVCGYSDIGGGDDDWAILRLNPDGTLDNTFDDDGKLILGIINNNSEDQASAIVYDTISHKITVAGDAHTEIGLIRLHPNGTLDNSFGNNGKVTADIPNYSPNIRGLIQNNDSIWVCGPAWYGLAFSDGFVAKFTASGNLDLSFGNNGFAVFNQSGWQFRPNALVRLPDGKLLITGDAGHTSSDSSEIFLTRLTSNGQPDQSFGTNGILIFNISTRTEKANEILYDEIHQKIIVVGYSEKTGSRRFALLRLNLDGQFDASFGSNGLVITTPSTGWAAGDAATLQTDGKIVLLGHIFNGASYDFAFTRHLQDDINHIEDILQTNRFHVAVQPNPVINSCQLLYSLPESCTISADIWDVFGRRVKLLFISEYRMAGTQSELFDSENLPAGIYFIRLQTSNGLLFHGNFVKNH